MGASNELPESEELDALYDRFLVRREVKQVSSAGIMDLLQAAAAAPRAQGGAKVGELGDISSRMLLTAQDFDTTRCASPADPMCFITGQLPLV